jgi:hypothetical protein
VEQVKPPSPSVEMRRGEVRRGEGIRRTHLAVVLLVQVKELLDLVEHEAEAALRGAGVAAVERDVRGALVEVVPVDGERVDAVDGALGALLRAAVVGDSVVVHVERERRRVVGVRQVLDLDQVVVVVVVGGERKLEVYPLVVGA